MTLAPVIADGLAKTAGIRHGFCTRAGGVSKGLYTTLNCGAGSRDDQVAVAENRRRVADWIGAGEPILNSVHQVHGTNVVEIDRPWPRGRGPKADALVSGTAGVALTILTADCAPILFADAEARIVGAAHAGWRGALAGIAEATLAAMERLGAKRERIRAAVGPCIGQESYEVGPEFRAAFIASAANNAQYFVAAERPGHHRFDLPRFVADRLTAAGIEAVECLGLDTYGEPERFFSYRRGTHRGEADYGRAASVIMLQ